MKCCDCKQEMKLDDKDFNFKGCYDNYWLCERCNIGAFEKVRYGKSCFVEYSNSNGEIIQTGAEK